MTAAYVGCHGSGFPGSPLSGTQNKETHTVVSCLRERAVTISEIVASFRIGFLATFRIGFLPIQYNKIRSETPVFFSGLKTRFASFRLFVRLTVLEGMNSRFLSSPNFLQYKRLGAGADGGAELHAPQASQEEDDDDPDRVEDDEASATEEDDWEEDNERSERSCAEPVVDYIKQRNRVLLWETVTRFPKEPRC